MFYTNEPENLRSAMKKFNLEEVRFKFDFEGTKVWNDHLIDFQVRKLNS